MSFSKQSFALVLTSDCIC